MGYFFLWSALLSSCLLSRLGDAGWYTFLEIRQHLMMRQRQSLVRFRVDVIFALIPEMQAQSRGHRWLRRWRRCRWKVGQAGRESAPWFRGIFSERRTEKLHGQSLVKRFSKGYGECFAGHLRRFRPCRGLPKDEYGCAQSIEESMNQ